MDIGLFACLAIVVIGAIVLFISSQRGALGVNQGQGQNRPQSDNPNIASGGSFGGPGGQSVGQQQPTYDNPNIHSGGSFGGPGGQHVGGSAHPQSDNPNIASGGSFGGGGQSVGEAPHQHSGGQQGSSGNWGGQGNRGGHVPGPETLGGFNNQPAQPSNPQQGRVPSPDKFNDFGSSGTSSSNTAPAQENKPEDQTGHPHSDNPNIRSGGSFGG